VGMLWGEHIVTQHLNFVWGYNRESAQALSSVFDPENLLRPLIFQKVIQFRYARFALNCRVYDTPGIIQ
jgi:hypothetical protein